MDKSVEEFARDVFGVGLVEAGYGGFIDSIARLFAQFRAAVIEYGCEHAPELVQAAKMAYDQLCAATDIPVVPEYLERQLEEVVWNMYVAPALDKIVAKVCAS